MSLSAIFELDPPAARTATANRVKTLRDIAAFAQACPVEQRWQMLAAATELVRVLAASVPDSQPTGGTDTTVPLAA